MRLVHAAKVIKRTMYIFFGFILVFYTATEVGPSLYRDIFPAPPEERPVLYKFSPIVFSTVSDYPSGENGIDLSNTKIIYRRNAQLDWTSLPQKTIKLYAINQNLPEDIDYLQTAKGVALFLGYSDLNLVSTGVSDDKYIWGVPEDEILFVINKKNKKMEQKINSISKLKNYLTSGEFVNTEFVTNNVKQFMVNSKKFNQQEIQNTQFESTFLRFEGESLVETPILSSEIAYVKAYNPLNGKKIVGNNYETPSNFMYVSSLRPEIAASKKNYRFPRFSIYKNEYVEVFNGELFDLDPLPNVIDRVINSKDFVIRGITFNDFPHNGNRPKIFKIENISIESFEIAYFDDFQDGFGKNSIVQPIYLFKGNFDTSTGQRGKIILYAPAISPKYYN